MKNEFSIYSPYFYDRAKDGAVIEGEVFSASKWFLIALTAELADIADSFGCTCKASDIEIETARLSWLRDLDVLEINGSGRPDHFKHAGILAYWLRRRAPLRSMKKVVEFDTEVGKNRQRVFLEMSHELVAYMIGYDLARFANSRNEINKHDDISNIIRSKAPNLSFAQDMCVLMKTKHISPHALMMIYRAIHLPA